MEDNKKTIKSGVSLLQLYWQHTRKYPVGVFLVIVGVIIIQGSMLAAPLFLRQFFNLLVSGTPTAATVHHLFVLLAFIAGMYLIEQVGLRLRDFSNGRMQAKVMSDLMESAFSYLINHSYSFFISNFAGSLTSKVGRFGKAFESIFDTLVISFFPTFLFVTGTVVVLFLRNHVLGIALGLWAIAFISFQVFVAKMRQPIRATRAAADTKITGTLADAISNHSTIELFSGAHYEQSIFREVVLAWQKLTIRLWDTDNLIWTGIGLFLLLIEIGLLGGAVIFWQKGLLTVGDFALIQAYLITTFDRLVSINRELRGFYSNFADASEMMTILNVPHEIQDVPNAKELVVKEGTIDCNNVTFYFNKERLVLDTFNLSITAKEKVALVGPSGAGKSTITKLLLRMFDIEHGSIKIDNQDIKLVTKNSLHDAVSFVPQEPVLFHRTLLDNIRYGKRDATEAEVIEAAKKAHCHEFISGLSDGYNTYVGERGVKLSGGERQRVAIARAILKNAPILILDEATSSLDSESEALIQDALRTLMEGKTVMVIAHRLSTIMKMDRIVVLEKGVVAATGTHDELLEHKGLYHKLWSIQAGGFLVDEDAIIPAEDEPTETSVLAKEATDD